MSETAGHLAHQTAQLRVVTLAPEERARWVGYARLLAWLGVGWHSIEAAIAVIAGWMGARLCFMPEPTSVSQSGFAP